MHDLKALLKEGAKRLGIDLTEAQVLAFISYLRELKRWNRRMNLTSIKEEREIIIRHFLDSLTPADLLGKGWKILDVGSGAGFPGIPLKIARPDLIVTLIDSSRKKVVFQRHIIRLLALEGIEAIHGRVEGLPGSMSEAFDAVLSRAFTDLPRLAALSLPLLRPGGILVAMKGRRWREEMEGMGFKGFEFVTLCEKPLPFSDMRTYLVVLKRFT